MTSTDVACPLLLVSVECFLFLSHHSQKSMKPPEHWVGREGTLKTPRLTYTIIDHKTTSKVSMKLSRLVVLQFNIRKGQPRSLPVTGLKYKKETTKNQRHE